MERLNIHLRNERGVKTIIKNLKRFDKDLSVKEYGTFIVVESRHISHYINCNGFTSNRMCVAVYDNKDYSKELFIPLDKIDTIFA